jgi:hypothetical protein
VFNIAVPDEPPLSAISQTQPTPAQLEALYAAASSGNIDRLKVLFAEAREDSGIEAFALANDASSRTGLTVLHAAASRGFRNIVKWRAFGIFLAYKTLTYSLKVIENCGAIPGMEDKEGEVCGLLTASRTYINFSQTALHKAALNGHLDVIKYLLPNHADVHARDADGWTALHNACSKVSLIYLCHT